MAGGGGDGIKTGFPPLDYVLWFIGVVFDINKQTKEVGDWGVSRALYLSSLYIGLFVVLGHLIPALPAFTFRWMFGTAPLWLPVSLWFICWYAWIWYIQALFLSGRNPVLLEMKIPREIMKSPRAMELALSNFSISSGETTFIHRGWKGQTRTYFSFEIASFGGEIHFYIWCWKNYRAMVEASLYAQYPEIELVEVEDYAAKFQFDADIHTAFCTDWRRETYMDIPTASRRIDAYPIKTYVDFELDKDPKEEFKVEPLAQVVEYLGSIKPNEQAWIQIVFRKAGKHDGVLVPKDMGDEWIEAVKDEVEFVRFQATEKPRNPHAHEPMEKEEEKRSQFPHPTEREKEQLQAMDRNYGKFPFEVGMRGIYITTGDLHGPTYSGMRYVWRAFNNPQYRSHLRPRRWMNDFDYPWQDVNNVRWTLFTRRFLDAFRRRSFFASPWKTPTFVMTSEEIASIWHPLSATVQTPGLERIPATKASAPSNLPR